MNRFSFLKYPSVVLSGLLFLTSCDKDYNTVGNNIISDGNYLLESTTYPVTTYNQFDAIVQTNNLALNQLGIIDNGVYGVTTSSLVTQLQLAEAYTVPPTAVIDEVELVVPYYSTVLTTVDLVKTFKLDSIYPGVTINRGKINLSIYENTKYLKNYDDLLNPLKHYSDEFSVFETYRKSVKLNDDSNTSQNSEFQFSEAQQQEVTIVNATNVETTKLVDPRMRLKLSKSEFQNILINGGNYTKLLDNGIFQNHFRGLFFKVENIGTQRALALLNFSLGKINVYYKEDATDTKRKQIILNMTGNNVNLFQNTNVSLLLPTNTTPAPATNNLYLKGGSGYHSYLDLFDIANTDGVITNRTIINNLKAKNWLINDANLIFTVDKTTALAELPKRIYLYNVKSRKPILDYYTDGTGTSTQPKYAKSSYGGIISSTTKDGVTTTKYKIKITNHLRNIIQNDSLNIRLGLSVTEDITKTGNRYLKNTPTDAYYNRIPEASVINPLGTILYGSDASIDVSKRVQLEIFYTKPN